MLAIDKRQTWSVYKEKYLAGDGILGSHFMRYILDNCIRNLDKHT